MLIAKICLLYNSVKAQHYLFPKRWKYVIFNGVEVFLNVRL